MKRLLIVLLTCGMLVADAVSWPARADDTKVPSRSTDAPNAAVIYWQAFSAIPTLNAEQKQKYEAATKAPTAPLDDELEPIIAMFSLPLHEIHRARSVAPCDWQLDYDAGPHLWLSHLQKARDLSRAGLLRARLRFADDETDAAISDVLDVLKMARDCGSSPTLISYLVGVAIESNAQTVLAAELPRLKAEQLDQLAMDLKKLPPSATLAEGIRFEDQMFGGWLERRFEAVAKEIDDPQAGFEVLTVLQKELGADFASQPKPDDADAVRAAAQLKAVTVTEVRSWIEQLRRDYDEIAKMSLLAPADRQKRWAEFEAELTSTKKSSDAKSMSRHLSALFLPAVGKAFERAAQHQLRRELMSLVVQVQRHGPEALKSVTHIEVEHHKTATGFELRVACLDKTEVLAVGIAK